MTRGLILRAVDGAGIGATVAVDTSVVAGRYEADLRLPDPAVSRRHASFEPRGDGLHVRDLGSSAGVRVNGHRVTAADVAPGDVVELGTTKLRLLRLRRFPDAAAGAALRVGWRGSERLVPVHDGLVIGRQPECDVHLDDATVSRRHAIVHAADGTFEIEDLQSANGTRVGGRPVRGRTVLRDGGVVEVGTARATLTFVEGPSGLGPVTVRAAMEGSATSDLLTIDAGASATVAEVTRELAGLLRAPDSEMLLYRLDDGALLHPDDQWWATGPLPGDELVLGPGDASAFPAAPNEAAPPRRNTAINQLPRTVWPEPTFVVERIDPPEGTSFKGRGLVWQVVGGLGAVLIGLALVLVNPDYAVFGLITGGIGIVSLAASILGEQSRRRHAVATYRSKLEHLDRDLAAAATRQSQRLAELSPTTDDLAEWLSTSSPRIWERRPGDPDALRLRLGTGRRATALDVERARSSESPLAVELADVLARHRELDGVPIAGPGPATGSLGVTGDTERVKALVTRLVVEAAVLHAPGQLRIWMAASGPGWEWCRWLPHVSGGGLSSDSAGAGELLERAVRAASDRDAPNDVLHLVVVPDATRRLEVEAHRDLAAGRGLVVVAGADRRDLPSGLAVVLDVEGDGQATTIGSFPDGPLGALDVDGLDDDAAERIAIALGRLAGATTRSAPSGLVGLLGLGSPAAPDVAAAWARSPHERLTVAIGSDDSGNPVTVGFRRDGPHGMIAGTTGSGKSELLQTILTALVLTNAPDRLNLFLVDYKGGSTFAPLAGLPHVAGLVTDLEGDTSLAARALTALDAEIDRRKRLLEAARVPDVIALERTEGAARLPDLLVVIDEFALLVERQPNVRDRLDTIATQGRSLGIHMLLATQSPTGVISHAIRTNTNLWVCLRVVTESESVEILGARDAAHIPDGSPGRALIRLGASRELQAFQAARIARPADADDASVRVVRVDGRSTASTARATTTELDLVVAHVRAMSDELGIPAATPLWLAPLPHQLSAAELTWPDRPTERLAALVGRSDQPRQHTQPPWAIDFSASGHALVTGLFGFGKTTTLTQIATDLSAQYSPDDVHIYGIDSGAGSLGPVAALAHVGDVVGAHDVERLTRLIDRLTREVDRRRDTLAAAGQGDFVRWRAAGGAAPWIVLLVDDYPAFREVAEQVDLGRLLDRFNSLLHNGPGVGIHIVVAASQAADLRTREVNLLSARLVLRAADTVDYALVDARFASGELPMLPPGRGLTVGSIEVQVAQPHPASFAAITRRWAGTDPSRWPRRVARLPRTIGRQELSAPPGFVALGVGGNDVEPVALTIADGLVLLVAGPIQSGRSTALAGLTDALLAAGSVSRALLVAPRRGPLAALGGRHAVTVHVGAAGTDEALDAFDASAAPGGLLVIDDAEQIGNAPGVASRLEQILREAAHTRTSVLVGARVSDLPAMFDPWARYLVSLRQALLLQPSADDAYVFGVKLPTIPPPIGPGRGVLIDRTHVTVLQVAGAPAAEAEVSP